MPGAVLQRSVRASQVRERRWLPGAPLRWAPPRSAMTMDYRQDRVNVMYDDAYKITQVTCG